MKKCIFIIISMLVCTTVFSQAWKTYPYTPEGSLISFPVDEGRHTSEPVEWWYTTGHVTGSSSGKHYSYMLSYFYYPASIFDGFRILNVSDDDQGVFFDDTKALNYTVLATDKLSIEANVFTGGIESWHTKTDMPFEYDLSATGDNAAINLTYDALKPPLILAGTGYYIQGSSAYTYYYSLTKNTVSGTITFDGTTESVTGTSWIDKQYGTFNPANGHEYEWFSIQLSNGMDINTNNIFTEDNRVPDTLTYRLFSAYVDETTQYTTSDFEIERLKYTCMPDNEMCYSQKWRITSPIRNVDLVITTLHSNYEVELPFRFYEGPTTVSGTVEGSNVTGVGFAELVHSYEQPDIQISGSAGLDDESALLTWQLNNPDDGNPLKYDLAYSIDNQVTFLPLAQELSDTYYFWDAQSVPVSSDIWLKVTGYSIDATLTHTSTQKINLVSSTPGTVEDHTSITIYPNPSEGEFTIEGVTIRKIEIFDTNGKLIYWSSPTHAKPSINLSSQSPGTYFVKLTTDSGTITNKLLLR